MHRANMRLWLGLLRGVFFFDRNAYDGDVVFSAGLERQPDERRTRIIERMRLGYRLANHRIRHQIAQTIRAHHINVALLARHFFDIDFDFVFESNRPQNDVFIRKIRCIFGPQFALVDEVVHERVIARHLRNLAFAHAINARVADVSQNEPMRRVKYRRHRRSHPLHRSVLTRLDENAFIGIHDGIGEQLRLETPFGLCWERQLEPRLPRHFANVLCHVADAHRRRHLPRRMPPHAIG